MFLLYRTLAPLVPGVPTKTRRVSGYKGFTTFYVLFVFIYFQVREFVRCFKPGVHHNGVGKITPHCSGQTEPALPGTRRLPHHRCCRARPCVPTAGPPAAKPPREAAAPPLRRLQVRPWYPCLSSSKHHAIYIETGGHDLMYSCYSVHAANVAKRAWLNRCSSGSGNAWLK